MTTVNYGTTIQLYPNKKQKEQIDKTIGCKRFVYNYFLNEANINKYKSYNKYSKLLTQLKIDKPFLREVDKFALQNALKDLDDSFKRFFNKQNKYPKFKSKKDLRQSYRTNLTNKNIEIKGSLIKLPKLSWVKIKKELNINKINNVTVFKKGRKYYVSISCETKLNNILKEKNIPKPKNYAIGIDLGISDYAILSDGTKYPNHKYFKKYEKKLIKLQKQLSRCQKNSNNYTKLKSRINKLHSKIANTRKDYLHKLSKTIINENQVIVVESLKIKNMIKNPKLAKHIQDCSWGRFLNYLEYKSTWYGRDFIKINTYFPSSQLCSSCGYKNKEVKDLKIRHWECPICGVNHDRDINSAINIKKEGLKLLMF